MSIQSHSNLHFANGVLNSYNEIQKIRGKADE